MLAFSDRHWTRARRGASSYPSGRTRPCLHQDARLQDKRGRISICLRLGREESTGVPIGGSSNKPIRQPRLLSHVDSSRRRGLLRNETGDARFNNAIAITPLRLPLPLGRLVRIIDTLSTTAVHQSLQPFHRDTGPEAPHHRDIKWRPLMVSPHLGVGTQTMRGALVSLAWVNETLAATARTSTT